MSTPSSELLRIDPLTGCKNFLGFLESCLELSSPNAPGGIPREKTKESPGKERSQYAVLFIDMNNLEFLNESKGRAYGDSVIHWMGILLGEESNNTAYRLGGDEFAVLLNKEAREEYAQFMERILVRMARESKLLGFPSFPADTVLILYDQAPVGVDTMLMQMGEAMVRVKSNEGLHHMVFDASDLQISALVPRRWNSGSEAVASYVVRWLSQKSIFQVLEMGRSLDKLQQDAYTDAISMLPNMKAALLNMEQVLNNAISTGRPFSILMIDGDNIRAYNSINYAAGDEMIRRMSTIYRSNLRPNDFVARWRTGDEFIVTLPDTPCEGAKIIAERFRLAIKEASQTWQFPVTISIGIASYPMHGTNMDALIDQVESANKRAKDQGKDQVVVAGW